MHWGSDGFSVREGEEVNEKYWDRDCIIDHNLSYDCPRKFFFGTFKHDLQTGSMIDSILTWQRLVDPSPAGVIDMVY